MKALIATGFNFEPLPCGNLRIEFVGDDGKSCNTQVITPTVVKQMPLIATLTEVALTKGPEVVKEIMAKLNQCSPTNTTAVTESDADEEFDTTTVAELIEELGERKGKAKILILLHDGNGQVIEGVLPEQTPKYGVGDDSLNVVCLYGVVKDMYHDDDDGINAS